jgi:hypothetical protein
MELASLRFHSRKKKFATLFKNVIMSISFFYFLGSFAKLRKATISFDMSVCPSVCLNGTTRLPLDGFLWNFIF